MSINSDYEKDFTIFTFNIQNSAYNSVFNICFIMEANATIYGVLGKFHSFIMDLN